MRHAAHGDYRLREGEQADGIVAQALTAEDAQTVVILWPHVTVRAYGGLLRKSRQLAPLICHKLAESGYVLDADLVLEMSSLALRAAIDSGLFDSMVEVDRAYAVAQLVARGDLARLQILVQSGVNIDLDGAVGFDDGMVMASMLHMLVATDQRDPAIAALLVAQVRERPASDGRLPFEWAQCAGYPLILLLPSFLILTLHT